MTRPKRKLNTESSSGPFWPWVVGVAIVLVLLVGIGLGVALSGGNEKGGGAGGVDPLTGLPTDAGGGPGTGGGIGSLLNGTGTGGTGTTDPPKVNLAVPPPKANPKLLQFISENTVYLVGTTNGRFEMTGPETRSDLLGDFFKKLKAHDQKHGAFSTDKNPPTEFSPATYTIGIDPINLKASQIIKYSARGGTLADPAHYHLDKMTIVMHSQNPAKKNKGIAFYFPGFAQWGQANKRPWISVAGKTGSGIKPFYLVPLETTQPNVALINLKVGGGIQFDDKAMTAKADPKIESAMKKLLKDNGLSGDIKFWAGAPLAKWASAHVNDKETIDFKVVANEKKKAAVVFSKSVDAYKTNVEAAINKLFPAAQAASTASKEWGKADIEAGKAFGIRQRLWAEVVGQNNLVATIFKKNLIHKAADLSPLIGRKIQNFSDLELKDFDTEKFKQRYGGAWIPPNGGSPTYMHLRITQQCTPFFTAKSKYLEANKKWKEKMEILKKKKAALTQKDNEFVNVVNQLTASRVANTQDPTSDAGQIRVGRMTLDTAKKKWKKILDEVKKKNWEDEITKWDDPKRKKAEWDNFKEHPVFYLGAPSGTLIQFSK